MSFILDALRKSENARQRHGGPALAEVPVGRRRESRPWWIWVVAALLAVNLVVLLVVLMRAPGPAEPAASAPAATAPPAASVTAVPAPVTIPQPVPPAAVDPAPLTSPAPAPAATAAVTRPSLADEARPEDRLAATEAPSPSLAIAADVPAREPIVRALPAGTSGAASGGEESLPTVNELTGDRAAGLPDLHLDIHVYSGNPAERFVFINMRKYTEGAMLQEGPVVERIRADGVVLNQRGFRFILPRQ